MIAGRGDPITTAPLTPVPAIGEPLGSLRPTPVIAISEMPLAAEEMFTLHVYSTEPSGIASVLDNDSTSALTPVQLLPLHPGGCNAKAVPSFPMSGLTVQS